MPFRFFLRPSTPAEAHVQGGRGAVEDLGVRLCGEDGAGQPAAPVEHRLGGQPAGRGALRALPPRGLKGDGEAHRGVRPALRDALRQKKKA